MQWVKIFADEGDARKRMLPHKPQLLIIHGKRLCLVLHDDSFYAVQDSCTHSGASLSKGNINYLGEVVCPLHGYCFDLQNGREINSRCADLQTFPVKIDESGFYIGV